MAHSGINGRKNQRQSRIYCCEGLAKNHRDRQSMPGCRLPATDERRATVPDTVLYEKDSHIVTITYHRPERMNAINGQMRQELNAAWLRFRDDADAWVAILTGAGRAFCAGADIREGGAAGTFAGTFWEKPTINSFESGLELFKPTIAAINGPCLGYGVTAVL